MDENKTEAVCKELCKRCNENEAGHYHSAFGGGICDGCAEDTGCDCGCFPSPQLNWHCDYLNEFDDGDFFIGKDDNEDWSIIEY